jgi:hypothetical protein
VKYTKKYIDAVYKSGRKDLIDALERNLDISFLSYEYITLEKAITSIRKDIRNIKYIRKELQEDEEFVSIFTDELIKYYNRYCDFGRRPYDMYNFLFTILNDESIILSEPIRLFIRLTDFYN